MKKELTMHQPGPDFLRPARVRGRTWRWWSRAPAWLSAVVMGTTLLLSVASNGWGKTEVVFPDLPVGRVDGESVLFAFDRYAFPFGSSVEIHLKPAGFRSIVMEAGSPGQPDELTGLYGTVQRIDGKFHMWYSGKYGAESPSMGYGFGLRDNQKKLLCYARSDDGIHWQKPSLGLVEHNGSTANNIVLVPGPLLGPPGVVFYDAAEPDPAKKYKLAYEAYQGTRGRFCVAFSADGLRWTPSPLNPVGPFFEMSGITRFKGKYYVSGQDDALTHQHFNSRTLATFVSADFEHWSPCGAVGLDRIGGLSDLNGPSIENETNIREEVHLGAALWNRGNVLVGVYGQFHGDPLGDRRLLTMDLGLTLSHDAVHHFEPLPNFKLVPAREQPGSPADDIPALVQGQGMENVGSKTYYWYSLWRTKERSGVRLATWDRDRLGMLRPIYSGAGTHNFQTVSCAFSVAGEGAAKFFVNASGLSANASLRVNLLDNSFQPLAGYTAVVAKDDLRAPIDWENNRAVTAALGELHVQVKFEGLRPEDSSLYALYIVPQSSP